ncbi:MAG: methyl-accepting chemotaxis protein [Acidobacteriota bacterium]
MKLNLKRKVLGLAFLAATLPVLVMLILTSQFEGTVAEQADQELSQIVDQSLKQIAKDVYAMCETTHQLLLRKANDDLTIARQRLQEAGVAELSSEAVSWTARNQRTGEALSLRAPKLIIGGRWVGQSLDLSKSLPVVDETHRLVGAWCSILQRVGDQGELLRVATSVEVQGRRATGTLVPAVDPYGERDPVVSAAAEGRSYSGLVNVAGHWLVTAYQPLKDRQGKVIGMLEVAQKPESTNVLRKAILQIKVGKTGYVCVVGGKGERRGRYIISYQEKRDGEDIWTTRDADGRFFIQGQLGRAFKQPAGEPTLERYWWQNQGEQAPRAKIASLIYFRPWDWLINVGTYQEDYYVTRARIHQITRALLLKLILAGAALLVGAVGLAAFLSDKATRPLGLTIDVANQIAAGDLSQARSRLTSAFQQPARARKARFFDDSDETVELLSAFDKMSGSLDSLVGQVQRSGIQVTTSATQISSSARELEAAVAEQAASTREVTARTRDISKTAEDLSKLMTEVGEQLATTASTAESRRNDLSKMEAAMRQLMKATGQITSKLGTINERANRISSVITTINKISDQTNLLSLNAAIEAEKAGEFGKGFAVVAREISRLADQTAVATQDIEYVVREMQSSVASGVMEMDRFAEQVRKGVSEVAAVGDELTRIIDQVRNLGPEFGTVEQWMQNQSQGAEQISESMGQLSQTAEQTKESLHEFKQATEQLNQAVQGLQNEVSRFKISA